MKTICHGPAALVGAVSLLSMLACQGTPDDLLDETEANEAALAGAYIVYDDVLQSPFVDVSWTMHNLAQGNTIHGGTSAIQMTPSSWGGIRLVATTAMDVSAYGALDFWVNGGSQGGQLLRAQLVFGDNTTGASQALEQFVSGGVPANAWAHVTIPFSALGVTSGKQLKAITIMANTGNAQGDVFLDDISLTVAAASTPAMPVFDDQMENSFSDGSWGTHNAADTTQAHSGKVSMSFAPTNWSGLQWNHGTAYNAGAYTAIDFWANGGTAGNQNVWVGVTGTPKGTYRVSLAKYGQLQANTWTHFTVPLADLGATGVGLITIYIMDAIGGNQPTMYVDDLGLIPAAGSTTGGTTGSSGGNTPQTTPGGTTTGGGGGTTGSGGGTTTGSGGGSTTGSGGGTTGSAGAAGWLYTKGNVIYTSNGNPFHGRGANIADPRGCGACTGTNVTTSAAEVNRRIDLLVDGWKANFLRLDLESYNTSGAATDASYLAAIKSIVDHIATKSGVYVELSMWVDPTLDSSGWPTSNSDASWKKLVDTFASYPQVLFGISNEPQNNYDGSLDAQVWQRMNDRAAVIRAEEAMYGSNKHIILAQGTGGWARFLSYYQTHPLTAGDGSNFAYEVHVYDAASTFNDRFINPGKTIPVVIGEFGPTSGFMTLADCTTLMQQAEASGVPYLGWTFHMRCPPNLLQDNSSNGCGVGMNLQPTSDWGVLLKNRLAQSW